MLGVQSLGDAGSNAGKGVGRGEVNVGVVGGGGRGGRERGLFYIDVLPKK